MRFQKDVVNIGDLSKMVNVSDFVSIWVTISYSGK